MAELKSIVLRAWEEALGASDGGLSVNYPYQMASEPETTSRTPFHRDWPLSFKKDLRISVCTLEP